MGIKVTFEFGSREEAIAFLNQDAAPKAPEAKPAPSKSRAKRETGQKAAKAEPAKEPEAPKQVKQPGQALTDKDVMAKLREVFDKKGAGVATSVLLKFEATRFSDVKPQDFEAFYKVCEEKLA